MADKYRHYLLFVLTEYIVPSYAASRNDAPSSGRLGSKRPMKRESSKLVGWESRP